MSRTDSAPSDPPPAGQPAKKRAYVKQTDVPSCSLEQALRVAQTIRDEYGKKPTPPLDVAAAMGLQPQARGFRMIAGASVAYGFTVGGWRSEQIALTDLGMRAVAPTEEGDDVAAKREAFLRPRVTREFLEKYDSSPLPSEHIGRNVLEAMGVDAVVTKNVLAFIVEGAEGLGLLRDIGGKKYVHLRGTRLQVVPPLSDNSEEDEIEEEPEPLSAASGDDSSDGGGDEPPVLIPDVPPAPERNRRVFVSHGSDRKIVATLKDMLEYGDFEPVVSVERETTSKPVPDKVLDDMRSCGAGIIHVGVEKVLQDADGEEHRQLNANVLIEIGAAMALYGRNFILLVEEGTTLPSNLQGLYEVRYEGKMIDGPATMRLLKALKDFKR